MEAAVTGIADAAVGHQDLEEATTVDSHVQRLLSGLQRTFGEDLLGAHHSHTGTQLQAGWQLGILGALATGLALDLIKQILELGPVTLEAGGRYVGQVVGNGRQHGVLGGQTGLADPKCVEHHLSPRVSVS